MAKSCVYCNLQLEENAVVDVCHKCGKSVWGERMFNAIVQNMEHAREEGDLYQGSVTDTLPKPPKDKSIVPEITHAEQDPIAQQQAPTTPQQPQDASTLLQESEPQKPVLLTEFPHQEPPEQSDI